jgi:hypothetical protein
MALIRALAGLVLASALVAGCSQSLFDNPDDDGDGPPDDPGLDGGVGRDDAGNVIPPDANPNLPPDAAVPTKCPAPCLFDAVAEFGYSDTGASGVWLYAEDKPSLFGTSYSEMSLVTKEDGTRAYVTGIQGPPAIVHCPSHPDYPNCAGVEDKILFETAEPGASQPALAWIVPPESPRRRYRLSGDWRVPSNAPTDVPMTLLLVRNSRFDAVVEKRFLTSTEPAAFDIELDLQPSDILRLIAMPGDATPVPVALSLYISATESPDVCLMTNLFETDGGGSAPLDFPDLCAESLFKDQSETGDACPIADPVCPPTASDFPPTGVRGRSRAFVEGASALYQGEPNRYVGDWTVQFWAYLDSAGSWTTEALLADLACDTQGGIRVARRHIADTDSSEVFFEAFHEDPGIDFCNAVGPTSMSTSVTDDQWHFFRITRSTATGRMSACVDGEYRTSALVPGDADMSATERMWLGRNVTYNPAYFRGKLAELRVFEQALPCSEP